MVHMLQKRNDFKIIESIRVKSKHIRKIAEELNLPPSTVLRTMKQLEQEGVVDFTLEGKNKVYNLKTVKPYGTFFADSVLVHNKENPDPIDIPEICPVIDEGSETEGGGDGGGSGGGHCHNVRMLIISPKPVSKLLYWDPIKINNVTASCYNIRQLIDPNNPSSWSQTTSSTSAIDLGYFPFETFYWQTKPFTDQSCQQPMATDDLLPINVYTFQRPSLDTKPATLSWSSISGATKYKLLLSLSQEALNSYYTYTATEIPASENEITIQPPYPAKFYWALDAVDNNNQIIDGPIIYASGKTYNPFYYSSTGKFKKYQSSTSAKRDDLKWNGIFGAEYYDLQIFPGLIDSPQNLDSVPFTDGAVATDVWGNISVSMVYRDLDDNDFVKKYTTPTTGGIAWNYSAQYAPPGLTPGAAKYYWRVRAKDKNGDVIKSPTLNGGSFIAKPQSYELQKTGIMWDADPAYDWYALEVVRDPADFSKLPRLPGAPIEYEAIESESFREEKPPSDSVGQQLLLNKNEKFLSGVLDRLFGATRVAHAQNNIRSEEHTSELQSH